MTVSNSSNKATYLGNGIVKEFTIPFKFFKNSEIEVYFRSEVIVQKKLVENIDYTVSGAGDENGGSVTLNETPQTGDKIVILRIIAMTQEIDYQENEIFPAETQERALDKLTMLIQQLDEKTSRAVILPVTGDGTPEEAVEEVLAAQEQAAISAQNAESSSQSAQTALEGALAALASAQSTVEGFDDHAAEKQSGFDTHVAQTTSAFDAHASEQQALVDALAQAAAGSAASASESASECAERIADFEANGSAVVSTDMRYFNVVTAAEYAALPAEKKTAAYFYIVIPG